MDLALQIVLCAVLYDCFFFLCHSAMHTKLMYNRFHKFHHLSKISIAPTALYFHPVSVDHYWSHVFVSHATLFFFVLARVSDGVVDGFIRSVSVSGNALKIQPPLCLCIICM